MRIEALWQELENEAQAQSSVAWLTRFALPEPAHPLLVALELPHRSRALLLALPLGLIPAKRDWPECRGLEPFTVAISSQPYFGVRLREPSYSDMFSALAEDVAPRVAAAQNPKAAATALIARLLRWQKFLAAGVTGLSPQRQRGLYGELLTLRTHVIPAMGAAAAVAGWRAPHAAHQDFQFGRGAMEVKTTIAKQPQAVRITSERQLDDTGVPALYLHVVFLDEREPQGQNTSSGESLPDIVHSLRLSLHGDPITAEMFEDHLLDAGYLQADAHRYQGRRFALRGERTFHVKAGFPRIVEADLPPGIGAVGYDLALAPLQPFSVTPQTAWSTLTTPSITGNAEMT